MRLHGRTEDHIDSPIGTAHALLAHRAGKRDLLDLSQAVPPYPPADAVVEHVARAARDGGAAGYTPVPGLPRLREAFAAEIAGDYAGHVTPENVIITAGCNQAFCVVASVLARESDEMIMPLPFYFNHDMWLRMTGIRPVYLDPGPDLVARAAEAERLITPRTRAISLVTPVNPSGATLTPAAIEQFAELARRHDIALILDETYRSFRDTDAPAHDLFADTAWTDTLISLHSFSKEYAIPGYRVGAVVAAPTFNREIAKIMDCVAICAPRLGQEAAWAGLSQAREWRAERAREIAGRRGAFTVAMEHRPGGFELLSCGAFFGWVRHPFPDTPTDVVVRDLVAHQDMLVIPGTAFLPDDRAMLRVSVSNADEPAIDDLTDRLTEAGGLHAG